MGQIFYQEANTSAMFMAHKHYLMCYKCTYNNITFYDGTLLSPNRL